MDNNLIGRKVYYKAYFAMLDKYEAEELVEQKRCIKKEEKYKRFYFLCEGNVEALGQAGDGMNSSPCLIISNVKIVNKPDVKRLKDKDNASIPLTYCFFDQIISLDSIK